MNLVIFFVVLLAFLVVMVRVLERKAVFFPQRDWLAFDLSELGAERVDFEAEDGTRLVGLWFPRDEPAGVILHCMGNAGNLSMRVPMAEAWREMGYSVFLFDYRGYGQSAGKPSEEGILLDARAAWREAERRGAQSPIVSGRSLGTVPAIRLAGEVSPRGLLLDSPLESGRAMARTVLPLPGVGLLVSLKLDNLTAIESVDCPVMILHSPDDEVIPFEQGRRIFDRAPEPKQFLPLEGLGHNDSRIRPSIQRAVLRFLRDLPDKP